MPPLAAHTAPSAPTTSDVYHYDARTGRCVDANGAEGRNQVAIEKVGSSKNAECADLRGVELLPPAPARW